MKLIPSPNTPNGEYKDYNPVTREKGTTLLKDMVYAPQKEIENAISAAGLTPDSSNLNQLTQAIVSICQENTPDASNCKSLFDFKLTDRVLTGDSAIGWLLAGSMFSGGAGATYDDAYQVLKAEFDGGTPVSETVFDRFFTDKIINGGCLIDENGIVSSFYSGDKNNRNIVKTPGIFAPGSDAWEIEFEHTVGQIGVEQRLIGQTNSANYINPAVGITSANKFHMYISGNGTSWNLVNGTTGTLVVAVGDTYKCLFGWDGAHYYFKYSLDGGSTWTTDISVTSTIPIIATGRTPLGFGNSLYGASNQAPYRGTINLLKTQVTIGGSVWWNPTITLHYVQATNGHKIIDLLSTAAVAAADYLYSKYGVSDFYRIDTDAEYGVLPKTNEYFRITTDPANLNKFGKDRISNVNGSFGGGTIMRDPSSPTFEGSLEGDVGNEGYAGSSSSGGFNCSSIRINASRTSNIGESVQPRHSGKLLYYYMYSTITDPVKVAGAGVLQDIAALQASFVKKVNKDMSNIAFGGELGTNAVARLGMPSDRYIDLTLESSGSYYTAKANGYYTLNKTATASNQYITIQNTNNGIFTTQHVPASGNFCRGFLPVVKGQIVQIDYTAAGTTNVFRFIYAEGAN